MSAVTLSNCTETLCYVNSQVKRLIELFHLTIFRNIKSGGAKLRSLLSNHEINGTRSIASTSKIKSRLTAALVINSFESRPADLVTTVTDHPIVAQLSRQKSKIFIMN